MKTHGLFVIALLLTSAAHAKPAGPPTYQLGGQVGWIQVMPVWPTANGLALTTGFHGGELELHIDMLALPFLYLRLGGVVSRAPERLLNGSMTGLLRAGPTASALLFVYWQRLMLYAGPGVDLAFNVWSTGSGDTSGTGYWVFPGLRAVAGVRVPVSRHWAFDLNVHSMVPFPMPAPFFTLAVGLVYGMGQGSAPALSCSPRSATCHSCAYF